MSVAPNEKVSWEMEEAGQTSNGQDPVASNAQNNEDEFDTQTIDRDPHNLNKYMECDFNSVIAEPKGLHSVSCLYSCSKGFYSCILGCSYNLFVICTALPLSCCWALTFAWTSFYNVWVCTPCLRMIRIMLTPQRKMCVICFDTCYAPCCEALGLCLSNIKITTIHKTSKDTSIV